MTLNIENLVEVLPFEGDYAIFMVKDGSFGVLNCNGEVTIPPVYAQLDWLGPDRLLAFSYRTFDYVRVFDIFHNEVLPKNFDLEVIDSRGNVLLPKDLYMVMVYDYFDGRYIVEIENFYDEGQIQCGVIKESAVVISFESGYKSIRRIGKYYLAQRTSDSRYVLLDYNGEYIRESDRFSVGEASDYIAEYDNGLWHITDLNY